MEKQDNTHKTPEPRQAEHTKSQFKSDDHHAGHNEHQQPAADQQHGVQEKHSNQGGDHSHHVDHTGHEMMLRHRFWVSLALSIPVLLYSATLQQWLNFSMPVFPGSYWITPLFAVIVFFYGGLPFLQMAVPEVRNRQPGMMTLISLAIIVAFGYSLAALFFVAGTGFFWELVTLIDVMLLGHWIEMRSVRQASGARPAHGTGAGARVAGSTMSE